MVALWPFEAVTVTVVAAVGAVSCSDEEEAEVVVAVEEVEEVDAEDMDEVDRTAIVPVGCTTVLAPRSEGWAAVMLATLSSSTSFDLAETVLCLFVALLVKKAKGARPRLLFC